ncbi:SHOCT domain-containing protein [Pedobacter jejuensis]|uniref:SHOCT domain-containing protein n=1 Tax=Pedobacter jejuensis TaxID=1268550 RepID=A0A3N0C1G4_9SPHI|nr:SHOCT domain-containing protein [Pedobacter jejuensis]
MFFTNNFLGMDFLWWIFWFAILVWIFLVPYDIPGQRNRKRSAIHILQERFAKGAIDLKEYERNKKILERDKMVPS